MSIRKLVRNLRLSAERLTQKRMGRERADESEDDEAWDLEFTQALEDVQTARFDDIRNATK